ncbi:MAG: PilZ domain-containing protein [Planctomycetota bacterium]
MADTGARKTRILRDLDRRSSLRVDLAVEVQLQIQEKGEIFVATMANAGLGGALLLLNREIQLPSWLMLIWPIEGAKDLKIEADLVWIGDAVAKENHGSDDYWPAGIAFRAYSGGIRTRLAEAIAEYGSRG